MESAAKQIITRRWWRDDRQDFRLVTSAATLNEVLRSGRGGLRDQRAEMIRGLDFLPVTPEAIEAAAIYAERFVMPADQQGDALHLAIASFHGCDFLLTWNCKHLANANKTAHIERVNREIGFHVPRLVTPEQLTDPDRP